jgi:hypothetical protein
MLVGEHDFASFARPGHGRESTVRTVRVLRAVASIAATSSSASKAPGFSGTWCASSSGRWCKSAWADLRRRGNPDDARRERSPELRSNRAAARIVSFSGSAPLKGKARGQNMEIESEVRSQRSGVRGAQKSEVSGQRSGESQRSEVSGQRSGESQRSEVSGQRSGESQRLRSQRSGVRGSSDPRQNGEQKMEYDQAFLTSDF